MLAQVMIDLGSEINLMLKTLFNQRQWAMDQDIEWMINLVNQEKQSLREACLAIRLRFGNICEYVNISVHELSPFDLLIETLFILEFRIITKTLKDKTYMA
jgi:hypothetical protein